MEALEAPSRLDTPDIESPETRLDGWRRPPWGHQRWKRPRSQRRRSLLARQCLHLSMMPSLDCSPLRPTAIQAPASAHTATREGTMPQSLSVRACRNTQDAWRV